MIKAQTALLWLLRIIQSGHENATKRMHMEIYMKVNRSLGPSVIFFNGP